MFSPTSSFPTTLLSALQRIYVNIIQEFQHLLYVRMANEVCAQMSFQLISLI